MSESGAKRAAYEARGWQDFPLDDGGRGLIEASAGTGKTWTISVLYLRLLLERGLAPRQIVVTTFTDAAAQELRERLGARVRWAERLALAAQRGEADDDAPDARWLRARWSGPDAIARDLLALRLAQADLDLAPVTTLHSLCRRILAEFPFDSRSPFGLGELVAGRALDAELFDDLWRRLAQAPGELDEGDRLWFAAGRGPLEKALRTVLTPNTAVRMPDPDAAAALMRGDRVESLRAFAARDHYLPRKRKLRGQLEALAEFIAAGDCAAELPKTCRDALEVDGQIRPECVEAVRDCPEIRFALEALAVLRTRDASAQAAALARYRSQLLARREALLHARGQLTFDALLTRVHAALHGDGGEALAARLREAWPVALVDEFQDTDALQFAILDRIHPAAPVPRGRLVMIGDPKQAIYRFRGGDIHAYLRASASADARLGLRTNFRSSSALIGALNALFAAAGPALDQDGRSGIGYVPVAAAGRDDRYARDGAEIARPLVLYELETACGDDGGEEAEDACVERALVACANRIARLLDDGRTTLGERPLAPGDVAVLLPRHADIQRLRDLLQARGVPCVAASNASVFATDSARELAIVLHAVHHAGDEAVMRAALATRLLGCDYGALRGMRETPARWQPEVERFHAWRETWRGGGVLAVVQAVIAEAGGRLLQGADAERVLTDLRHLGELLQAAADDLAGPEELLAWFAAQRAGEGEEGEAADEQQLRIESDARRVRVMTLHASKGLEFPVVFLPLMWRQRGTTAGRVLAVATAADGTRELDIGGPAHADAAAEALAEDQAERFRLLYVALTRARHACHVFVRDPARATHADPQRSAIDALLARALAARDGAATLAELAAGTPGLALEAGWDAGFARYRGTPDTEADVRAVRPEPARTWPESRFSFSALVRAGAASAQEETAAADERMAVDTLVDVAVPAAPEPSHPELQALGAVKGAEFGNALHAAFEHRVVGRPLREQLDLLRASLREAGVRAEIPPEQLARRLAARLDVVLAAELLPGLRLGTVPAHDLLAEMEFNFVLGEVPVSALRAACAAHGEPDLVPHAPVPVLRGLMNGKIDLILRHDGRFHVLDYKSNFLGERLADYAPAALPAAMDAHHYRFQALIYTVAVDRYLRQRLPGYARATHLGEAIYLFVRAVGLAPGAGVWMQRFDDRLIDAVDAAFAQQAVAA